MALDLLLIADKARAFDEPWSSLVEDTMRIERHAKRPDMPDATGTSSFNPIVERGPQGEILRVAGDLRFAPGSAALLPPARSRLNQFVDWLRTNCPDGDYYIEIQGKADVAGSDEQYRVVSRARAEVVRRYLCTRMRLPVETVGIMPAGSLLPFVTNRTSSGRTRSRRAVVLVLR